MVSRDRPLVGAGGQQGWAGGQDKWTDLYVGQMDSRDRRYAGGTGGLQNRLLYGKHGQQGRTGRRDRWTAGTHRHVRKMDSRETSV
jgi:hypothetical protein